MAFLRKNRAAQVQLSKFLLIDLNNQFFPDSHVDIVQSQDIS